jgi:peptide subunit release factor 1 (eRF1)
MLDAKLIHSLPRLQPPILSVYLDTNPAEPRNQRRPSGARIWLKSRGQVLAGRIPAEERKQLREQLKRVDQFLESRPERERGVVIFAGPNAWHVLRLQVNIEDELHWGRPSLTQFLWLLDEHQPCGVTLVDRSGARLFRFWLGEAEELRAIRFDVNTSEWRRKQLVGPSHGATKKVKGAQRDEFQQRLDAQYAKLFRDAAAKIRLWAEKEQLDPIFVAGPNEVAEPLWSELPERFRERAALVKGFPAKISVAELQEKIAPEIEGWKRSRESAQVHELLSQRNGARAAAGIDETLEQLQQGAARQLFVVRGLGGKLKQCEKCGWTDRSADRVCASCGGERRVVALRAVLPELARKFGVPVEVVAGEAGNYLRKAGGLAVWLR